MEKFSEKTLNDPRRWNVGKCANCNSNVRYDRLGIEEDRCKVCGSNHINITLTFSDKVPKIKDRLELKAKDDSFPSKKKVRTHIITGDERSKGNGQWVKKTWVLDKDNNRYFEHVENPQTGEVIHHCDEPLSDHQGHGTAKFKKTSKESI